MTLKFDYINSWIQGLRMRNYATGSLPAAGSATKGAMYLDSTLNTVVYDDGTSLQTISTGSGNITGSLTSGRVTISTGSSTISDDGDLLWDNSAKTLTAGSSQSVLNFRTGIMADLAPSRLTVSAKLPASPGSTSFNSGVRFTTDTNGATQGRPAGAAIILSGTYSGGSDTSSLAVVNAASSTGSNPYLDGTGEIPLGNTGLASEVLNSTTGGNFGVYAVTAGASGGYNYGLVGITGQVGQSANLKRIGVTGASNGITGTGFKVGGYFLIDAASGGNPTLPTAALIAQSDSSGSVFIGRTTTTTVFEINSSGNVDFTEHQALSFRTENIATGSLPAAGNKGRLITDSTANTLLFDDGTTLQTVATSATPVTVSSLGVNSTDLTVTATSSGTDLALTGTILGTNQVVANTVSVGTMFRFKILWFSTASSNGAGVLTPKLRMGTTSLVTDPNTAYFAEGSFASSGSKYFSWEVEAVVRSTGVSGTMEVSLVEVYGNSGTYVSGQAMQSFSSSSVSIDTTSSSNTFALFANFSSFIGTWSVTVKHYSVTRIDP